MMHCHVLIKKKKMKSALRILMLLKMKTQMYLKKGVE